ncbi:hypothetical protein JD844_023024 [Phrynosoma platyrhinos]|uniref:Uncharacterized protein n=1 Tax=Phrynosoma platyrhinos TaxID=52577 RepID=A0ABQ7SWB6_PHRPL|nr:hypothetical protein JD844_023024 [Phrynosoma platyrhinos]
MGPQYSSFQTKSFSLQAQVIGYRTTLNISKNPSNLFSIRSPPTIEDVPFDEKGLFNNKTNECLEHTLQIIVFNIYISASLFVINFQFARHIKKSEGQKTPKVELQISIYGVKILDPKTKINELETENMELKNKVQDLENQLRITQVYTSPAGSVTPKSPSTDIFDMVPFSPISPQSSTPTRNGTQPPPVPSRSAEIKRDLFGAEPFDPFSCGAGDFPPDIQSKLDEMQVIKYLQLHTKILPMSCKHWAFKQENRSCGGHCVHSLLDVQCYNNSNNKERALGIHHPSHSDQLYDCITYLYLFDGLLAIPFEQWGNSSTMEGFKMGLTLEGTVFCLDPLDSRC